MCKILFHSSPVSHETQLQEYVQKKQLMRERAEALKKQRKHAPGTKLLRISEFSNRVKPI